MTADLRWWRDDETDVAGAVFRTVRRIQQMQGDRITALLEALCLYDDWQALGLVLGDFAVRRTEIKGRLALNMIRSCCDTVHAEIIQSRPRPMFLTAGGDFTLRRKGERMGKFIEGVFSETDFDDIASQCALDALVCGYGAVRIDEQDGRVCLERVLPYELWVDRRDGYYGHPRAIYLTRWVDRQVLIELYPDSAEQIKASHDVLDQSWRWEDAENDQVCVVEAWHLPSGKDSGDGRHVIAVSGATLYDEEWTSQTFPFAFLRWKRPTAGFYPRGLADELRKLQRALNVATADIEEGQEAHTHTKVGIERGSKINKGHFTSDAKTFIEFDRNPPVPIVFPAVAPEVYNWVKQLVDWCFQISGTSQAASRSEKQAGVVSGVAVRMTADLQSKRFISFARSYERFYIDTAREIVRMMERLSDEDASYDVVFRAKSHVEKIGWGDVKLDEGSYALQVWPTNLLPSTPQGRLETIMDMLNSGFADKLGIPGEQILKLMDFPDTEAVFSTVTAAWELVEKLLEKMLDAGDYSAPEPFYNLSLCVLVAVRHYMQWRLWDVPEDRMDLLRQWISDCKALMPPPAPPAAPPVAPPGPAPDAGALPPELAAA